VELPYNVQQINSASNCVCLIFRLNTKLPLASL